jgi:rare lipoprotein A
MLLLSCTNTNRSTQSYQYTYEPKDIKLGKASYYASFFSGRKTANGEIYSPYKLTAAHRALPFGTVVKVTNLNNNKSVVVTINDRGPYVKGRIIDLSREAAKRIGMLHNGVVNVKVELL